MSKQTAEQILQNLTEYVLSDWMSDKIITPTQALAAMHQYASPSPGWIKDRDKIPNVKSDKGFHARIRGFTQSEIHEAICFPLGDSRYAAYGLNIIDTISISNIVEWLSESPAKPEGEDAFIDKHMKAIKGKIQHYKDAHELSGKLIDKHIKPLFNGLQKASVEYFVEKGTISGAFYEALTSMIFELFPDYEAAAHSPAGEGNINDNK